VECSNKDEFNVKLKRTEKYRFQSDLRVVFQIYYIKSSGGATPGPGRTKSNDLAGRSTALAPAPWL